MSRAVQIVYIFCILLFITGCKKDVAIPKSENTDECQSIPHPIGMSIGYQSQTRDNSLNKYNGIADPTNPNFFYYLIDHNPGIGQIQGILIRSNLMTGEKLRIDSSIIGLPQLNKKGWFVYTKGGSLNLFKIKSNGDSLTQLTNNGNSLLPFWSFDDNFVFYTGTPGIIKITSSGMPIDTIENKSCAGCFKNSNKILFGDYLGNMFRLVLKNLDDNSEKVLSYDAEGFGLCVFNNNDSDVFWNSSQGIYRLNILTNEKSLIVKKCPSIARIEYDRLYTSPLLNYLIVTRYDRKLIDDKTIYYESNLYKINFDGSAPTLLNVP